MKIITKYNIKDKVYFISSDNYIFELQITGISFRVESDSTLVAFYENSSGTQYREDILYATKDDAKDFLHERIRKM